MEKKKEVGLTINQLIIAAISLIVLGFLISVFTGQFNPDEDECEEWEKYCWRIPKIPLYPEWYECEENEKCLKHHPKNPCEKGEEGWVWDTSYECTETDCSKNLKPVRKFCRKKELKDLSCEEIEYWLEFGCMHKFFTGSCEHDYRLAYIRKGCSEQ